MNLFPHYCGTHTNSHTYIHKLTNMHTDRQTDKHMYTPINTCKSGHMQYMYTNTHGERGWRERERERLTINMNHHKNLPDAQKREAKVGERLG